MGRRGPKKAPILKLRTLPGIAKSPYAPSVKPDCPSWLSPSVKERFDSLAAFLFKNAAVTALDGPAVALVADAIEQFVQAEARLAKARKTRRSHAATERGRAWDRLLKGLKELGLTPASAVGKQRKEPVDPLGAFAAEKAREGS